jgi:phage terminase large subunit-like protein
LETDEIKQAAEELKRRYEANKLLYYKPCCRVHSEWADGKPRIFCPVVPCPESKHALFHKSEKRIRIVFGGNRSSKTFSGVAELLMMACLKNHPYRKTPNPGVGTGAGRFRIYSSDYAIIEKLFLPLIRDLVPMGALAGKGETKGEKFENSYDPKYHMLHLKSGILDFLSYDQDQSKSESVELDGVMADEEMPENIYAATLARLISRQGRFWMTVTPLYGMSWGMQFLENSDPQVEVFRWEIFDNPYIQRQAIEDFEKSITNPLEKEARIYGRFMEFQGLVYKELDRTIHFLGNDKPKSTYPVVMALDPHPRRPSAISWAFITPKGDTVFFDELEASGTAREIVRSIRDRESTHGAKTLLRLIDPAAKSQGSNISFETDTLREFELAGMNFSLADNSEAGYGIVHEYLGYDKSRPMDSMNRPRCYFTKDVPKTWYSMTHLMWDEWAFRRQKHWKDKKERVRDYQKDFSDTVRYILAERPTFRSLMMPMVGVPTGNWMHMNQPMEDSMRRLFVPNAV